MLNLSDLLHGKIVIVPADRIWSNETADCAQIRIYSKKDNNNWVFMIIGEHFGNHLYTECERCGNAMVERIFREDEIRPSLNVPLLCFHCRQLIKHGESEE